MDCGDKRHTEHICALTAKGDLHTVHALALHPNYVCGNCGAKAHDQERLCDPNELPEIGDMGDGADVKL